MTQEKSAAHRVVVVAICGSIRPGSYTRMALEVALHADVFRLRREVGEASGIILGTPEYHGSFSGVLKNALDLMGFRAFEGKMLGLVGVFGGALGAVDALNSLRSVGRALHAWVIPEQAGVASAYRVFDDAGAIKDAGMERRLKLVGRQVARFAFLRNSEMALDFLRAWEGAPENPGGAKG